MTRRLSELIAVWKRCHARRVTSRLITMVTGTRPGGDRIPPRCGGDPIGTVLA